MELGELPVEITAPVLQLVVLMNFDIKNNSDHRTIWDAFVANRRPDRLPINFKIADSTHIFPKPKPKKQLNEITPYPNPAVGNTKYILKSNWFNKHCHQIPAVVVLFFDLDWDNPSFNEKKMECATKVEALRQSLQGRNSRVCVVLIQRSPPLPSDSIFAQRASELCTQCDLSLKSLFVLPLTEHLYGYILRLEHAFYELAGAFYQNEIKLVKQVRDHAAKFNNLNILTRYQIKLAFYNELRQDAHSALRHYKQAYQHILETKIDSANLLDIKIVAGILNFKISQISFTNGTPIDAISHFRKHVDYFKDKSSVANTGGPQSPLDFEHFAWMAKQFGLFADLFDNAVQNGLAAVQTQHPGFYYQSASEYANLRRDSALTFLDYLEQNAKSIDLIRTSLSDTHNRLQKFDPEFYGLRPWHALLSEYPSVNASIIQTQKDTSPVCDEAQCVTYLQWRECDAVDHAQQTLHFLNAAAQQYKRYKCPRMRLIIMVRVGELYASVGDYDKALQALSPCVWEYRHDRWPLLLRHAAALAFRCARAACNVKAFVALAMELCSPLLANMAADNHRERMWLQSQLCAVLAGQVPDLDHDAIVVRDARAVLRRMDLRIPTKKVDNVAVVVNDPQQIVNSWRHAVNSSCFIHILMHNIYPLLEVSVNFEHEEVQADEIVKLTVKVLNTGPLVFAANKLSIQFENSAYDRFCVVNNSSNVVKSENLNFGSMQTSCFSFEFVPLTEDVDSNITVKSLTLEISRPSSKVHASLQWESFDRCSFYSTPYEYDFTTNSSSYRSQSVVKVMSRKPQLNLQLISNPPVLMGEISSVFLNVVNKENVTIKELRVRATFPSETDTGAEFLIPSLQSISSYHTVVENVQSMEQKTLTFDFRCGRLINPLTLSCEVSYQIELSTKFGPILCNCSKFTTIDIEVASPFLLSQTSLHSLRMDLIDKLVVGETSLINCVLKCVSHFSLVVNKIEWKLASHLEAEKSIDSFDCKQESILTQNDEWTLVQAIKPKSLVVNKLDEILKSYVVVYWQRCGIDKFTTPVVETFIELPSFLMENCPILTKCKLPAYSTVRQPFTVEYTIRNVTRTVLELIATMEASEYFMFAGDKQISLHLMPDAEFTLPYVYLPLTAGQALLPRLKLKSSAYAQEILDHFSQRNVPASLFVLPFAYQPEEIGWNGEVEEVRLDLA